MSYAMTERQRQVLDFVRDRIATDGISPSYQEIASRLGIKSKSCVKDIVDNLVARGHVKRNGSSHRSLAPTTSNTCPHCGHRIEGK